ncbi:D-arabinono-1,4-lactone oxidase [Tamaricihabitans halophyticus]|nr:D-arabinono-1,4-lactone oxidase [Tamaricihabitans halophyticus]
MKHTTSWTNWAGTVAATPRSLACPRDLDELRAVVTSTAEAGSQLRVRGSGHSFTPVAATDAVAVELSELTGIVAADTTTGLVTVRAGTPLRQLNTLLDGLGLAMSNLGDIDAQTIAGAISTGTHGTGARFGGLASQVHALELVLADGTVTSCSAEHQPELFAAAKVGLGALGVLHTVTLRCEPAFLLDAEERSEPIEEVLANFTEQAEANDHFEFYWFPYGRRALVKRNNRAPAGAEPAPLSAARQFFEYRVVENGVFGTLCRLGRLAPPLVKPLNRLSSNALSSRAYRDVAHRVFSTPRTVRFVESEYAVPRAALPEVLSELRAMVPRLADPVMFPVEVRVAAADDAWLSTAYQRDSAYIAVHQFAGMPYRAYFALFESIVSNVNGRPHWGKLHTLDAAELRTRYPRFDDFGRLRAEVDPQGVFQSGYLRRILDT